MNETVCTPLNFFSENHKASNHEKTKLLILETKKPAGVQLGYKKYVPQWGYSPQNTLDTSIRSLESWCSPPHLRLWGVQRRRKDSQSTSRRSVCQRCTTMSPTPCTLSCTWADMSIRSLESWCSRRRCRLRGLWKRHTVMEKVVDVMRVMMVESRPRTREPTLPP